MKPAGIFLAIAMGFGGLNIAHAEDDNPNIWISWKKELIEKIIRAEEGGKVTILKNKDVALEISEKNPLAAIFFSGAYEAGEEVEKIAERSTRPGLPLGVIPGLNEKNAKMLIDGDFSGSDHWQRKEGEALALANHDLIRTADGARLEIRISVVDGEFREIERIYPDIRVHLRPAENSPDAWQATGWDAH